MPYTPLQLADAFIQTGELQDALDALNQHLEANPGDDDARRLRIKVRMRMPDPVSLAPLLAELDKLTSLTADDYVQKSNIMQQLGRFKESSAAMGRAHTLKPDDLRIIENLVRALIRSKDFDSAKAVLAGLPRTSGWLRYTGEIAGKQGDFLAALKLYNEAISDVDRQLTKADNPLLVNTKVSLMSMRAMCYVNMEQYKEAVADYADMERLSPHDRFFKLWRGLNLARSGDTEAAVVIVWEIVKDDPNMLHNEEFETIWHEARLAPLASALRQLMTSP
jgi:tetratricopeptide (TPR) repeat protein